MFEFDIQYYFNIYYLFTTTNVQIDKFLLINLIKRSVKYLILHFLYNTELNNYLYFDIYLVTSIRIHFQIRIFINKILLKY